MIVGVARGVTWCELAFNMDMFAKVRMIVALVATPALGMVVLGLYVMESLSGVMLGV